MRRTVIFALVASLLVAIAVPGIAFATHSGGQGPKKDFANGTGQVVTAALDQQIHVNAQRKPSKPARGWIVEKTTEQTTGGATETRYKARVTCISAVGDPTNIGETDAVIGGQIVKTKAGVPTGVQGVLIFIKDGGEPGAGKDEVSRTFSTTVPDQAACQSATATGLTPITQGNYVVHDGTP